MQPTDLPCDVVYAGREILGELSLAESRELLVTNGIGGYASLTLAASLTRSYHGLLIAALRPPLDRTLLLTNLNDAVVYLGRAYHLATDRRRAAAVRRQAARHRAHPAAFAAPTPDYRTHVPVTPARPDPAAAALAPVYSPAGAKSHADVRHDEVVSPAGFELLESFRLEGTVPVFCYAFADALLEKRIWMKHGQNTVYVTYRLRRAVQAIQLRVKALVNHRNHHSRTSASRPHFNYSVNVGRDGSAVSVLFVTPDHQETTLCMRVSSGTAELTNEWVTGFVLSEERARGLPEVDDNLHAASFLLDLPPGGCVTFVASSELDAMRLSLDGDAELAMQHAYEKSLLHKFENARGRSTERQAALADQTLSPLWNEAIFDDRLSPKSMKKRRRASVEPCIKQLVLAADQFIISRGGGRSVVAGFHWFTDWARDVRRTYSSLSTMISLPGLTIVTGRYDVARSILQTFSKYVSKGMLPNRFPDDGSAPTEEDYNNADGTVGF
ncbi:Glycogen debranching enzyme, partial [Chondrus crispus]